MTQTDRRQTALACLLRRLLLAGLCIALILAGPAYAAATTDPSLDPFTAPKTDPSPVVQEEEEESAPKSAVRAARRMPRRRSENLRPVSPSGSPRDTQTPLFRLTDFAPSVHLLSAHPQLRGASLPLRC